MNTEQALSLHFGSNFYPALPQRYVPIALEVLQMIEDGRGLWRMELPSDLNPLPRNARREDDGRVTILAFDLYATLRLDSYKFSELVSQ